jgi:hypothetical protein
LQWKHSRPGTYLLLRPRCDSCARRSLPTLNGYSAWNPRDWAIGDPNGPGYLAAVRDWAARRNIEDACVLDLEARTISRPR